MSVLNMVVSRHIGNTEPVEAKGELIFHCGFRRFRASPLFSQHTVGKPWGSFCVLVHISVFWGTVAFGGVQNILFQTLALWARRIFSSLV